jgi:hypothetical protein
MQEGVEVQRNRADLPPAAPRPALDARALRWTFWRSHTLLCIFRKYLVCGEGPEEEEKKEIRSG